VVVDWVKREINEKVYIWGRSMGAVSSLLYEHKYKDVEGLILDSPFHSLKDLLIGQFTNITNLPNLIGKTVLFFGKSYLESYLRYDIEEMNVA
jgi:pimeloyl-ACP methyl ester carboxylesterase